MPFQHPLRLAGIASLLALWLSPVTSYANGFSQTNLISDVPGLAVSTDPNLTNPWGMAYSATSPFWIADQASSTAALSDGAGNVSSLVVSIPNNPTPPNGPTGEVQNSTAGFLVGTTAAHFIFDTLGGTIVGWASGTTGVVEATTPGAVYTGLALGSSGGGNYLYAADSTGTIRVFDSSYNNVTATTFAGKFVDPGAIAGYVPYNVQLIGSDLYVTYADLGAKGVPVAGSGGYVDVYDTAGNFLQRLATNGALFAPWGITLAPATFSTFGGDFLIGNFGNGEINAYSATGVFEGTMDGTTGLPIVNPDLWALGFRTGGTNDNPNALYFTAGINNQKDGLFGDIVVTPEPAPFILVGCGLLALALTRRQPQTLRS